MVGFTAEEEEALRAGVEKHGKKWKTILSEYKDSFHPSRRWTSLRAKWPALSRDLGSNLGGPWSAEEE
ncbi:hypothetical protein LINGRAHAP2_LOCUS5603, partial [Linum grandiflorum]